MDISGNNMASNGRNSNGQFAPGHQGFKHKNAPEFQRATREKLWYFFQEKIESLPQIFDELSPNNKVRALLTIAEFFLPKQREVLVETTPSEGTDLSRWSDEDFEALVKLYERNESR